MKQSTAKIFVSAYACEPGLGSEIGIGWHWVLEMSRYFELWVLTRESNRHTIEPWIAEHPEYSKHYSGKARIIEWVRRTAIKLLPLNFGFKKRCARADIMLCKTEITRNLIPQKPIINFMDKVLQNGQMWVKQNHYIKDTINPKYLPILDIIDF